MEVVMLEVIQQIVREAGKIMLNALNIQDGIESKQGRANFVTKYDVEVQKYLFKELKLQFPEAAFIGEEGDNEEVKADYCFIIDPIDGTTNFIYDYHHSAISVGLQYRGEMILGIVYNPYLNEMFYAEKGKGAYLNGKQIKVLDAGLSDGIVGFGTAPYYRDKADATFELVRKLFDRSLDIRRTGSAALDLCYVAAGRFVLFCEKVVCTWDYAAASLIITEAGGQVSNLEGNKLPFAEPTSILAAGAKAYEEFLTL
jgi:Archaeal fructose-1,6-bisphosphatase and related enzymes of inositol monophosphatase family